MCAVVVAAALHATALPGQQLSQLDSQASYGPRTAERLPRVEGHLSPLESIGSRLDSPYRQTGYAEAVSPDSSPQPAASPTGTGAEEPTAPSAESEAVPSVIDESQLDESQVVDLGTATVPEHVSGLRDFWGYRYEQNSLDWIIGGGDQFGMFSFGGDHYQQAGVGSGLGIGMEFHFVSGPAQTEMPPRLYDFSLGYQCRQQWGLFAYDVAASVVAASDFEGSAREGIRYPAHAVGYLQVCPSAQLAFGVDYLDRGDIKLLPVAGLIWIPRDDIRLELVFPRPRATFALPTCGWAKHCSSADGCESAVPHDAKQRRLYIAGDLGGGTWAVQRGETYDDLATYRDLRLSVGLECVDVAGCRSAIEFSYLFGRRLEFTSGDGNMWLDDTAMIRWICSH